MSASRTLSRVAALKRMVTAEMAERYIEGPNTYPELRSRENVGEKMTQQSHVPMDIGEVEGEIKGRTGEKALESVTIGKAREARSRQRA